MLLLSLALLGRAPSATPATYAVAGHVIDSAGTPLVNARIVLLGAGRSTTTGLDGRYLVRDLAPGSYRLSFAAVGFAPIVKRIVLIDADATLDVTMRRSLIELPALQVTATPVATGLMTSPQPTAVIGGSDLRTAQAPSLGETLRGVAGVHSLSTGLGIGKPVIRGLTSNRVLVLDNGQRMETQQWGDEHGPNVETATAERVEVIKGPASVLY
jgi:iron complex outermembrane receptor protein